MASRIAAHGCLRRTLFSLKAFLPLILCLTSGCFEPPPDTPSTATGFDVVYGSMTDPLDDSKVADDKQARERLEEMMQYVGVIPVFDERTQVPVPAPTIFGADCTFLDYEDSRNQTDCNMAPGVNMLSEYIGVVRANFPPSRKLLLLVTPYRKYIENKLGITNFDRKTTFLFDNQITDLAGGPDRPDLRWRGIAVTGMHEFGHLVANLTESENAPWEHNEGAFGFVGEGYPYGCIMTKHLKDTDFNRIYDPLDAARNPLIFCRTTSAHTEQSTTCHGKMRGLFSGLSYDVDH